MQDRTRQLLPAALVLAFGLTLAGCRGCGCGGSAENVPADAQVAAVPGGPAEQPAPPPEFGASAPAAPASAASDAGPPFGATPSKDQWKTLPPGSMVNIEAPRLVGNTKFKQPGVNTTSGTSDLSKEDLDAIMARKLEADRKEAELVKSQAHQKGKKAP